MRNFLPATAPLSALVFRYRLYLGLSFAAGGVFVIHPRSIWGPGEWLGETASLCLVLAGLALRLWAAACAGGHTHSGRIEAAGLATGGPYAYVRNPIYLGSILLGVGMVGLIGDLRLFPLCAVAFLILYCTIIPAEESFLSQTFGDDYAQFCSGVPRLLPRLTRWPGAAQRPRRWSDGRGEIRVIAALVVIYLMFVVLPPALARLQERPA